MVLLADAVAGSMRILLVSKAPFGFVLERPPSATSPERQSVFSIVGLEHGRQECEGSVERGAIIVAQIDEAGLLHQAPQLDQVAGALAPFHHPGPRIGSRPPRLQAMARRLGPTLGVIGRRQR